MAMPFFAYKSCFSVANHIHARYNGYNEFKTNQNKILARRIKRWRMGIFKKKVTHKNYDQENQKPVIRASICTGEQVVGFKDIHTGMFEEVKLIRSAADLEAFRSEYGIKDKIEKEY
jgi:hypothetical protein